MRGNANVELTFVAPNGVTMTSRPSPLWRSVVDTELRLRWSEHTAAGAEKTNRPSRIALGAGRAGQPLPRRPTATAPVRQREDQGSVGHASAMRRPRRQRRREPKRNDDQVTVSWCAPMSTTAMTAGTSPALDHRWRVPFCT